MHCKNCGQMLWGICLLQVWDIYPLLLIRIKVLCLEQIYQAIKLLPCLQNCYTNRILNIILVVRKQIEYMEYWLLNSIPY